MQTEFKNIFSPLQIGSVTVPNRIFMSAGDSKYYFGTEISDNERGILKMEVQSFIQYLIAQIFKQSGNEIIGKDEQVKRLQPAMEYINNNYRSFTFSSRIY